MYCQVVTFPIANRVKILFVHNALKDTIYNRTNVTRATCTVTIVGAASVTGVPTALAQKICAPIRIVHLQIVSNQLTDFVQVAPMDII